MTDKLTDTLKEGIKQSKETVTLIEEESKRLNSFNIDKSKQCDIHVVIDTLVCDITKGTRCKDNFPNYKDGICYRCGGQAN